MEKLKFTYFDFEGGRGQATRLALSIGNVEFEDDRVTFEQWAQRQKEQPFGALPVLHVGNKCLTQSNAINRYVGKLTDLYPSDPWQAAKCDETMDAVEEATALIGSTMRMNEEEKKAKRTELVANQLPLFLRGVEGILNSNGGSYFANGRLTVADLRVADWVHHLRSGILDHVPQDLVDRTAPALVKHHDLVMNDTRVKAYYAKKAK